MTQGRINEEFYRLLKHHETIGNKYFELIKNLQGQIKLSEARISALETVVNHLEEEINGKDTTK
jgi:hypothetical protein